MGGGTPDVNSAWRYLRSRNARGGWRVIRHNALHSALGEQYWALVRCAMTA